MKPNLPFFHPTSYLSNIPLVLKNSKSNWKIEKLIFWSNGYNLFHFLICLNWFVKCSDIFYAGWVNEVFKIKLNFCCIKFFLFAGILGWTATNLWPCFNLIFDYFKTKDHNFVLPRKTNLNFIKKKFVLSLCCTQKYRLESCKFVTYWVVWLQNLPSDNTIVL